MPVYRQVEIHQIVFHKLAPDFSGSANI